MPNLGKMKMTYATITGGYVISKWVPCPCVDCSNPEHGNWQNCGLAADEDRAHELIRRMGGQLVTAGEK